METTAVRRNVALLALATFPALASTRPVAVGPDAVVPDGTPLPATRAGAESICDEIGLCGAICPSPYTVFIGDFAYDSANARFAVIDVGTPAGVFWMDGASCAISQHVASAGPSQRGCAYDNDTGVVYVAGWNDHTIHRLDSNFSLLGSQALGEAYAGLAVDEQHRLLYAISIAGFDELIEYAINGDGSVTPTDRRWDVPWGGFSDGSASAALEYDDCSQTFMSVNQDAGTMEYFRLQANELVNTGFCPLPQGMPWGFGLDFASVELKVSDIASLSCDFPVESVEPDDAICGGGIGPEFDISYGAMTQLFVGSGGGPASVLVRNLTDQSAQKVLWLSAPPNIVVPLGVASTFPPGSNWFYTGVDELPPFVAPGDYSGTVNLGDAVGGAADASVPMSFTVVAEGLEP